MHAINAPLDAGADDLTISSLRMCICCPNVYMLLPPLPGVIITSSELSLPPWHSLHPTEASTAMQSLPAEVYPEYTTLEYQVPRARVVHPPAYIFVVDTCLPEDELAACRAALSQVR